MVDCGGRLTFFGNRPWVRIVLLLVTGNHCLGLVVPPHHLAGAPRLVGHHHRQDARHSQLDRTVERFAMAQVIVQIGMVRVGILSASFFVLGKYLAIFVFGDPAFCGEIERAAVASNQMVDTDSVALSTEHIDGQALGVFTNHLEVIGKISVLRPLPDPPHPHDPPWIRKIKGLDDARTSKEGDDKDTRQVRMYFIGRILGPNSPHKFLPDLQW